MRKFSVRPTLTVRGRKFKGLRGWSGKPTHPPLTDFPVAAYIFAAIFAFILAKKVRETNLVSIPDKLEAAYDRKTAVLGSILTIVAPELGWR